MENKTAMQQMLEWVRKTLPMDLDTPRMIEDKIELLLEREKEQIETAHFIGLMRTSNDPYKSTLKYYEKNYGKNN